MKGTLFANPTFIRKNIRQPTVISIQPLVVFDQHRLHFNLHSMKWIYKDIVNCTYLQSYKVLLVLTDDYKIFVFTQQLQLITILNEWEPKYIVGFQALEELNLLLLIGTEEIEVMKIKFMTNIKRTKFLSSMRFNIKREQHLRVQPANSLKWNRGYDYNIKEDLLYVWSTLDIHFFSLTKLTLNTKIINLAKKDNSLSIVLFNNHYKYTVTGMMNGEVKVWRLPTSSLYHHKEILIHNFSYHAKEIDKIMPGSDHRTIITAGLDMYVCFMSLETFQLLRVYNFSGQYSKLYLCDPMTAYAVKDSYLGQLNYGINMEFITQLTGQPIANDHSPHAEIEGSYNNVQITLNSNVGIQLNLNQVAQSGELNKINIRHHYPPLKSKNIIQILSSPFQTDRFFMMVQDGEIYSSKIEGESGKIDKHCILSKSLDGQKHAVNQMPSCIRFLHIIPPNIDTQVMELTTDPNHPQNYSTRLTLYNKLKLMAIGGTRGSIIFLSTQNLDNIYCRVSYHRERIINLQEVYNRGTQCQWMISICQQKYMKVVNFQGGKANCLFTVFVGEVYLNVRGFEEHLVIVQPKGVFQLCKFESYERQPRMVLNRQSINHQDQILSIDYRFDLRLIVTSGKDGKVKIWNTNKILIYQVVADQSIQHSLWGTSDNVILFMANKMYCLRGCFHLTINDLNKVQQEFLQDFDIDYTIKISDHIREILFKLKQKQIRVRPTKRYISKPVSPEQSRRYHSLKRQIPQESNKSVMGSGVLRTQQSQKRRKKITSLKTEESPSKDHRDSDLKALKKHLQEMSSIRKQTNVTMLPKLKPKNQDIFVQFMRQKLLNRKLLTRRDITLNRIIMKKHNKRPYGIILEDKSIQSRMNLQLFDYFYIVFKGLWDNYIEDQLLNRLKQLVRQNIMISEFVRRGEHPFKVILLDR